MQDAMQKSALLVMDVQPGVIDRAGDKDAYLALARKAVDHAHAAGILVIHVVVSFRPGAPEASEYFRAHAPGFVGAEPLLIPAKNDVVVTKRRISAFAGSDLEVLLRANDVRHLVLCGIATSGVVLSTLREAADKDYTLTVLADLCADRDPEVHRVLLEKVFPRQARVVATSAWMTPDAR
jgi:nicotinamidase-related amidase